MLNLNSVIVGIQYLFLEPNADDPLNKGKYRFICRGIMKVNIIVRQRQRKNFVEIEICSYNTSNRLSMDLGSIRYSMTE